MEGMTALAMRRMANVLVSKFDFASSILWSIKGPARCKHWLIRGFISDNTRTWTHRTCVIHEQVDLAFYFQYMTDYILHGFVAGDVQGKFLNIPV